MSLLEQLIMPFQFGFMQYAFAVSLLIAIPTSLLSCFLVLKGWSLIGDAISHAVLPGIVLAYIAGIPLAIGAFAAGMFCAISAGFLSANSRIKQDTVLGVVFSGMFGLGLVLYVAFPSDVHLDHILFGDMLGITGRDLIETGIIAAITATILILKWREFLLHAFDPAQAQAVGLRVRLLHYGLLCLISLTIVGVLKAVGIILAIAMLIAPGAIAFLLTRKFSTMMIVSAAIAIFASFIGVYLSFLIDSAPAPTIVMLMTIIFIVAFFFSSWRISRLEKRHIKIHD
ncbi:metal ABC transporter permease [Falsochrobactrum ovis]|uniref:ABC-type Mn2+/Zn2+ transport system permease subunit n=1 Tax=Falsochrobactrum ovis TaxID=1293442 RepID=A0A364JWN2_9HYPH|nr:metal ABC transporter permease [Falsochrobactrum ovis]RAK30877.1 ABC-type Mn2+/Zn2+ transport system permease subunit [Falsochrobactrum ovis]